MKKYIFALTAALFLAATAQTALAQGIVVNKTDGTKVYFKATEVESVTTYGYGEEPQPGTDPVTPGEAKTFTVGSISFTMVPVKAGTFQMGSIDSDAFNDETVHLVTLTKDYYIGQTEVTQGLWEAVMGQSPTADGDKWIAKYGFGLNYPAYYVSWNDCQTFITKLNEMTGQQFRLPTEAEWEYAARGGVKRLGYKYSGSNTIGDVAWYTVNSYDKGETSSNYGTHPVGTKQANELGIYDMSGNVWEWCSDLYGAYPSSVLDVTDPTGAVSGSRRVDRGGGWLSPAGRCRVASRGYYTPTHRFYDLGLRLAL